MCISSVPAVGSSAKRCELIIPLSFTWSFFTYFNFCLEAGGTILVWSDICEMIRCCIAVCSVWRTFKNGNLCALHAQIDPLRSQIDPLWSQINPLWSQSQPALSRLQNQNTKMCTPFEQSSTTSFSVGTFPEELRFCFSSLSGSFKLG